MSLTTRGLSLLAGAVLSLAAVTASAQDGTGYEASSGGAPSAGAMTVDLLVARPLGLVATVLGTVVFVASLPFQALAGNVADPARKLVVEPAAFTFVRPLGEGVN
ncbi:MAG: hypothetical protein QE272_03085 [Nevskia sp.]|jgi:hypothetical protein|nr:hypothetical protein [Gammaproteobacteria bacterium]MDH4457663.1 hypothetical protein [Nevskia sp.]